MYSRPRALTTSTMQSAPQRSVVIASAAGDGGCAEVCPESAAPPARAPAVFFRKCRRSILVGRINWRRTDHNEPSTEICGPRQHRGPQRARLRVGEERSGAVVLRAATPLIPAFGWRRRSQRDLSACAREVMLIETLVRPVEHVERILARVGRVILQIIAGRVDPGH